MGTKIRIVRICEYCNNEFQAQTTVTKYCSNKCTKGASKARERNEKIALSNFELKQKRTADIQLLNVKDFLTVKEVATLLSCSVRTVYYKIEQGEIKAVNLGERMTRVRRSDIDSIFERQQPQFAEPPKYEISDCYSVEEIKDKYTVSRETLNTLVRKHRITRLKQGWFVYFPKVEIHEILGE